MLELDLRRHVAQIGLEVTEENLKLRGYTVRHNGHNDHADLVIDDTLRVEVKASLWTGHKHSRGRYQFNTRQSPDLYVLVCVGSAGHAFVIPGHVIGDRANVAIWSQDPTAYKGQWSPYLDHWHLVKLELERCQRD